MIKMVPCGNCKVPFAAFVAADGSVPDVCQRCLITERGRERAERLAAARAKKGDG